jgi:SAM-dependent methyltransferase
MKVIDKPVEHYCKTADEYYKRLPRPNALLHKPFMSLIEASNSLTKAGPPLDGLHLGQKMTVLEFGAGTCWLSRFLALLGCRVLCLDVSRTALQLGERLFRDWPSLDQPIEPPRFLLFDGRRIDLPDRSVDRVVCFEALHHVPNPSEVLAEISRVLKDGGVAGFAEPGANHSEAQFSQSEMINHDVLELDIVMPEIWAMAKHAGFSDIRFRLFSFPTVDMSFADRNAFVKGKVPRHLTRHLIASMNQWSIFFLHKGPLQLDSRGTSGLQGEVEILDAPEVVPFGQPFQVRVRCTNTGRALWLGPEAFEYAGSVRLGPHLYDKDMRLLDFEMPRHSLPGPIPPGQAYDKTASIGPLPSGEYVLTFDLVAEFVTWFEALGTIPATARVRVR